MVKQRLMAQCVFGVVLAAGVLCLAGCETLKSTISGPFCQSMRNPRPCAGFKPAAKARGSRGPIVQRFYRRAVVW